MNCDAVFVILTRGPFPAGAATDEVVELHLLRCRQCRRLAEALRPSVEILQESVSPEEGRALPGYWGGNFGPRPELQFESTSEADETDDRTVPRSRFDPRPRPGMPQRAGGSSRGAKLTETGLTILRFAAAVILGIVLGAALRTLWIVP